MYLSLGVFSTTMTSSIQRNSQKVVKIFQGTIIDRGVNIRVLFNCYTDNIQPDEKYQCVDLRSVEDGVRYTIAGKNISNTELIDVK